MSTIRSWCIVGLFMQIPLAQTLLEYRIFSAYEALTIIRNPYIVSTACDFIRDEPGTSSVLSNELSHAFASGTVLSNHTRLYLLAQNSSFLSEKVFITKPAGRTLVSGGLGFLGDKVRNLAIARESFPKDNQIIQRLDITSYRNSGVYANVNVAAPLGSKKRFAVAADGALTFKRGYTYSEIFDETFDFITESKNAITYSAYDNGAYAYDFFLSAGIQRIKKSRSGRVFYILSNGCFLLEKEFSRPRYCADIQPYFTSQNEPTLSFSGMNNRHTVAQFAVIFSDSLSAGLVPFERPLLWGPLGFQFSFEYISLGMRWNTSDNKSTLVNRWKRPDGYYWGTTGHESYHSILSVFGNYSVYIHAFKYLYAHVKAQPEFSATYIQNHQRGQVQPRFHLDALTAVGGKYLVKNKLLIDMNYRIVSVSSGGIINSDNTAGVRVTFLP